MDGPCATACALLPDASDKFQTSRSSRTLNFCASLLSWNNVLIAISDTSGGYTAAVHSQTALISGDRHIAAA